MKSTVASLPRDPREAGSKPFFFPAGLPGLDRYRSYYVLPVPDNRYFVFLQAASEPEVALVLVDPLPFFPGYSFNLAERDCRNLKADQPEDLLTFTTVTFGEQGPVTNLAAPVVLNPSRRRGKQVIIPEFQERIRIPLQLPETRKDSPAEKR